MYSVTLFRVFLVWKMTRKQDQSSNQEASIAINPFTIGNATLCPFFFFSLLINQSHAIY